MIGDFNDILSNEEKLGGPLRLETSFQAFKIMLENCDMGEIGSSGNDFTWGGTRNNQWIQCKLDRGFGNPEWFALFPNVHQYFLKKLGSDHKSVLVKFTSDKEDFRGQFCFEKRWAEDPKFFYMIKRSWNVDNSAPTNTFIVIAANCRKAIKEWMRLSWSNSQTRINRLRAELTIQNETRIPCFTRMREIKKELIIAFRDEEIFWRQKSRKKWMHEGDINTKLFQATVKSARTKDAMQFLIDDSGIEQFSDREKRRCDG